MPSKSTKPDHLVSRHNAASDASRRKEVEKLLINLQSAGMTARDARFGLNNTMLRVPAKGGLVRVDLSRSNPSNILSEMFDAVWKAGLKEGENRERERTASSIMVAFPALKETLVKFIDDRIEAGRTCSHHPEE